MSDITTHHLPSGAVAHHDHLKVCVYCVEDRLDACPECGSITMMVRVADPDLGDPPGADGWLVECSNEHCDHSKIVPDAEFEINDTARITKVP